MKAVIWTNYGSPDVLQLKEVEKPIPKDNEVLIKIHATTVETGDCELRQYKMHNKIVYPMRLYFGLRRPTRVKILGQQLAGEIESVGQDVTEFKKGDLVFAPVEMSFGTYAEYICLSSTQTMAIKPTNMSFEEAAAVSVGGLNALHFLKKANIQPADIQPDQKILIYGTSGTIGTYAVQLTKNFGAQVTGVCSPSKMELVKSLGADALIDYTKDDFVKNGHFDGGPYDIIFDTIGKGPFSVSLNSLKNNGIYLLANPTVSQMLLALWHSLTTRKKVMFEFASYKTEDLNVLKELIEAGKLKTVIDRRYPLEQIVEAHRYVEQGHKKGNVIVTV